MTDVTTSPRSVIANVSVILSDVNDNAPEFTNTGLVPVLWYSSSLLPDMS